MSQIISSSESAHAIASGLVTAANSITGHSPATPDTVSSYPGNDLAQEYMAKEVGQSETVSDILDQFVQLIQATATEFVDVDQALAQEIQKN